MRRVTDTAGPMLAPPDDSEPASIARRRVLRQTAGLGLLVIVPPLAWAAPARRLVSIGGALTEIVYALDAAADLVGVDTTSKFPAAALALPNVGYARALSTEGILALSPTQVIATEDAGPPAVIRQIERANIPIAILSSGHRFEGLLDRVRRIGTLTAREEQAARLTQRLRKEWAATRARVDSVDARADPFFPQVPRILFALSPTSAQVTVAGRETSADAMIRYAGAANAIEEFSGFKPITPEAIIAARPDVILLTEQGRDAIGGVDGLLKLQGFDQTPAGRSRRVVALEGMFLLAFGPRLPAAVSALRAEVSRTMSS